MKYKITIERINIEDNTVNPQIELVYQQVIDTKDEQDIKAIINDINS